MKPVRMGLVGCGVIGGAHADAVSAADETELVAVADVNVEAAKAVADKYGITAVYDNADALFADANVEAVVLALITGVRGPLAIRALEAGRHVLLEKPAATSVAELESIKAAANGKTIACCSSRFSFRDGAVKARKVVESGALGPIRVVRCRGVGKATARRGDWTPPAWRVSHKLNGGGYMVNWGVYDLDYLMHVTGWTLKPKTVLAQSWPIAPHLAEGRVDPGSDAENHAISFIRCECGAVIVHERAESAAVKSDFAWEIVGERGSLRLQMVKIDSDVPTVIHDDTDPETGLSSTILLAAPGVDCQHRLVRDFAQAIREGSPPRTDIDRALIIQTILDAIYRSAASGQPVTV